MVMRAQYYYNRVRERELFVDNIMTKYLFVGASVLSLECTDGKCCILLHVTMGIFMRQKLHGRAH